MLRLLLLRLLQHIGHIVPHPAHSSHSDLSSVERAMGASHGATGWACEAARCAAHLVTLRSASEAAIGDRQRSIRRSHGICFIRVWKRVKTAQESQDEEATSAEAIDKAGGEPPEAAAE